MPWFAILIALAFTGVDAFTNYEITDQKMNGLYMLLTPFGLASVVKSGYDLHKKSKQDLTNLSPEEKAKFDELLKKVGLK